MNSRDPLHHDGQPEDLDHPVVDDSGVEERPVDPLDQNLVAYLDGELPEAETESIESRLATDPVLRSRLHDLQATWDMLDDLPRSEPDREFLKSTIEMVVTSAQRKKATWYRWPVRIGALTAAFLVMAVLTFQMVRSVQTRPYRQFVADLDFLQHVDMYEQIQEVEFLEALYKTGIFEDPAETVEVSLPDLPNRKSLDALDELEISRLKQVNRAFYLNPPRNQELLREIHQQISRHADREALLTTMRSYTQWLNSVSAYKYELAQLPTAERVEKVIELRKQQMLDYLGRVEQTSLPTEDVNGFLTWLRQFIDSRKEAAVERVRQRFSGNNSAGSNNRRRTPFEELGADRVFALLWRINEQSALDLIEADDVARLQVLLSEPTAATLDPLSLDDQRRLVGVWLRSAIAAMRHVSEDKLWELYAGLPDDDKSRLEGLPPRELRDALRRRYHADHPPDAEHVWPLFREGRGGWGSRRPGSRRRSGD
jgi:hypothetical protein